MWWKLWKMEDRLGSETLNAMRTPIVREGGSAYDSHLVLKPTLNSQHVQECLAHLIVPAHYQSTDQQ